MSEHSRGVVVGLVAAVALLAIAAGATGLAGAQDDPGENVTVEDATGPYDLETLEHSGVRASESAPASMRRWGSAGSLWVRYVPSGIGGVQSDSSTWQYMSAGETVERGEVYIGGSFGWGGSESLDVTIVYWDRGQERVKDDGEVRYEPAAVDQEVRETTVDLSHSFDEQAVDLVESYDDPRRATMMVEGSEGTAQWTFNVHTSRTAEPVAVDTRSDLALWIGGVLAVALLVVLASLYGAKKMHKKAGAGPGYPLWLYGALVIPVGFVVVLLGYQRVLNTIATAPWIMVPPVALITVLAAVTWWGDETRRVMVFDMDLGDPEVLEDGSGSFDVSVQTFPLATIGGHGREKKEGVVLDGISAYLARTRGAIPEWDIGGDPSVEYSAHGAVDEVVFTDPFDDDPINFKREGWSLDHLYRPPDLEEIPDEAGTIDRLAIYAEGVAWMELLAAAAIVATGFVLGTLIFSAGLLGALAATIPAFMWVGRPVKGTCEVNAAPGAFGHVVAQMITAGEELEELADRDYFKQKYFSEKGQNVAERKQTREESELKKFDEVLGALEEGDSEKLRDAMPDDATARGAADDD